MLKAVIFDMDGVIIDSEQIYHDVEMRLFQELGMNITEEERHVYVGTKTSEMWEELKRKYGLVHPVEELVRLEAERYREYLAGLDDIKPIPGIVRLISELHSGGIKLALASSSLKDDIDAVLEKFNLGSFFDAVVSAEDVVNGKPAPDTFLFAASELGVDAAGCIVIEDSANGVKAARAAGIRCVAYRNASSGNQDLSAADLIIDSFEEVDLSILQKLCGCT